MFLKVEVARVVLEEGGGVLGWESFFVYGDVAGGITKKKNTHFLHYIHTYVYTYKRN